MTAKRSGRNLPAAISVGAGIGVAALVLLLWLPAGFVLFVMLACAVSAVELGCAVYGTFSWRWATPLLLGAVAVPAATYHSGLVGLFVSFMALCCLQIVWLGLVSARFHGGRPEFSLFMTAYIPLLASFTVLMLRVDDGNLMVITYALLVISTDVGGYFAGANWGKRPLAPGVSPKKTWEGLVGSGALSAATGTVCGVFLLDLSWWSGPILAGCVLVAATVGDLAESLIKRDIGVKDLGSVLPGHGGVMERMDSLLVAAPVAYAAMLTLGGLS